MRRFWMVPIAGLISLLLAKRFDPASDAGNLLWLLPLGLFSWTLLEYFLHRFLFHLRTRNATLRHMVDAFHSDHHVAPRNRTYLFVRPVYAIAISAMIAAAVVMMSGDLFGTAGFMCGLWGGFLLYESVHYRVHLTSTEGGWIGNRRRQHFYHHFHNPTRRFGVTTSLWDHVFRTA